LNLKLSLQTWRFWEKALLLDNRGKFLENGMWQSSNFAVKNVWLEAASKSVFPFDMVFSFSTFLVLLTWWQQTAFV